MVYEKERNPRALRQISSGISESFEVKVGVHQESALSPFLFALVLDTLTRISKKKLHGACSSLMTLYFRRKQVDRRGGSESVDGTT